MHYVLSLLTVASGSKSVDSVIHCADKKHSVLHHSFTYSKMTTVKTISLPYYNTSGLYRSILNSKHLFFFFFFWKCIMSIMIKDLLIWYQLIISSEGLVNLLCTNVYLNTTFCNILLVVGSGAGYKIFKNTNITNKLFLNTILQTQLQPAHIFSSFFISFSKRHNKSI